MTAGCVLCGRADHEPWCAHFMRGPDAGGDPAEWPTLLEQLGEELLETNRQRVSANG